MPLKLLWTARLGTDELDPDAFGADVELRSETDPDKIEAHADWAEIVVGGRPSARLLDGAQLRHVVVPFTGIDAGLRERMVARPHLTLHNSHVHARFVAQHALALLLACSNRIVPTDRALRRGDWRGRPPFEDNIDLAGRRCLLIGFGAIGRALSPMLEGLGVRVSALRRGPPREGDPPTFSPDRLHEALAEADAAIVSLPATGETVGLIDEAALSALRPHALLVNVGRGDVIDEGALYRALRDRRLAAAAIDVWWRYPDRGRSESTFQALPFHTLPNVVMTPHRSSSVAEWGRVSFLDVVETVDALARGGERNRVDPNRGY